MTNYDDIAAEYGENKNNPIKQYSELPTFLSHLGDIRGKTVLDVACGDGDYTRRLKRLGAAKVIGVDISARMIARAKAREQENPLGIAYQVNDIAELDPLGLFDLVTAVYLFPYAPTKHALAKMAQAIAHNLKPGGRLLAITTNPAVAQTDLTDLEKYGTRLELAQPLHDGAAVWRGLLADLPGPADYHPG